MVFDVLKLKTNPGGTIFKESGDGLNYFKWFSVSTIGWTFVYVIWRQLFERVIGNKKYHGFDESQKAYWLSTWVSNTHHIFIISMICHGFYHSQCPESPQPWAWFSDESCFYNVEKQFV